MPSKEAFVMACDQGYHRVVRFALSSLRMCRTDHEEINRPPKTRQGFELREAAAAAAAVLSQRYSVLPRSQFERSFFSVSVLSYSLRLSSALTL